MAGDMTDDAARMPMESLGGGEKGRSRRESRSMEEASCSVPSLPEEGEEEDRVNTPHTLAHSCKHRERCKKRSGKGMMQQHHYNMLSDMNSQGADRTQVIELFVNIDYELHPACQGLKVAKI